MRSDLLQHIAAQLELELSPIHLLSTISCPFPLALSQALPSSFLPIFCSVFLAGFLVSDLPQLQSILHTSVRLAFFKHVSYHESLQYQGSVEKENQLEISLTHTHPHPHTLHTWESQCYSSSPMSQLKSQAGQVSTQVIGWMRATDMRDSGLLFSLYAFMCQHHPKTSSQTPKLMFDQISGHLVTQ